MTAPIARLDIIDISDSFEALALRPALEWWNIQVTWHGMGQAKDVVRVLGGGQPLSPNIFLLCHGDERGILLPELGAGFEKDQPYHAVLTPANIAEFVHLATGSVVINTGCATGTNALANAFLNAGATTYVGPDDYESASASLFYSLHLCYQWLCRGAPLGEAHARAAAHDEQTMMFRLFEKT